MPATDGRAFLGMAVCAALLVAGCGSGSTPPTAAAGQCWNATESLAAAASWTGPDAIDCATPHNSLTFAVATLLEDPAVGEIGSHRTPAGKLADVCSYWRDLKYIGHGLSSPVRLRTLW